MTEGEKRCGLGSFLPMSCRGRAEAFARRLHNRLRSLGSHDGDDPQSENSWLANNEVTGSVTSLQPRHHQTENDIFMDFGIFDTPGSPEEEITESELTKFITNPKDDLNHLTNLDECNCIKGTTGFLVKRSSLDSDSSDGPYYDPPENLDVDSGCHFLSNHVNGLSSGSKTEEDQEDKFVPSDMPSSSECTLSSLSRNISDDETLDSESAPTLGHTSGWKFNFQPNKHSNRNNNVYGAIDLESLKRNNARHHIDETDSGSNCSSEPKGESYCSHLNIQQDLTVECPTVPSPRFANKISTWRGIDSDPQCQCSEDSPLELPDLEEFQRCELPNCSIDDNVNGSPLASFQSQMAEELGHQHQKHDVDNCSSVEAQVSSLEAQEAKLQHNKHDISLEAVQNTIDLQHPANDDDSISSSLKSLDVGFQCNNYRMSPENHSSSPVASLQSQMTEELGHQHQKDDCSCVEVQVSSLEAQEAKLQPDNRLEAGQNTSDLQHPVNDNDSISSSSRSLDVGFQCQKRNNCSFQENHSFSGLESDLGVEASTDLNLDLQRNSDSPVASFQSQMTEELGHQHQKDDSSNVEVQVSSSLEAQEAKLQYANTLGAEPNTIDLQHPVNDDDSISSSSRSLDVGFQCQKCNNCSFQENHSFSGLESDLGVEASTDLNLDLQRNSDSPVASFQSQMTEELGHQHQKDDSSNVEVQVSSSLEAQEAKLQYANTLGAEPNTIDLQHPVNDDDSISSSSRSLDVGFQCQKCNNCSFQENHSFSGLESDLGVEASTDLNLDLQRNSDSPVASFQSQMTEELGHQHQKDDSSSVEAEVSSSLEAHEAKLQHANTLGAEPSTIDLQHRVNDDDSISSSLRSLDVGFQCNNCSVSQENHDFCSSCRDQSSLETDLELQHCCSSCQNNFASMDSDVGVEMQRHPCDCCSSCSISAGTNLDLEVDSRTLPDSYDSISSIGDLPVVEVSTLEVRDSERDDSVETSVAADLNEGSGHLEVEVEERIPRVRRCSSLKTGKTPPGTPGRKKIVRFADVLGLDLADVRTFMDEIPKIPISAYDDLSGVDLNLSLSDTSLSSTSSTLESLHAASKTLVPLFQQPGGEPNFLDRIRNDLVCLDNAVLQDPMALCICGTVSVRNLDFNKSVHIRYTLDAWKSFADLQATYVENSCDGFSDKFSFTLYVHTLNVGQRLEFAVRFQCKGCQYWDNNGGMNYCFQCLPPNTNTSYLPITTSDDWPGAAFY